MKSYGRVAVMVAVIVAGAGVYSYCMKASASGVVNKVAMPPDLDAGPVQVRGKLVQITGHVSPDAELFINDNLVAGISQDGRFDYFENAEPGRKKFVIVAKAPNGFMTSVLRIAEITGNDGSGAGPQNGQ